MPTSNGPIPWDAAIPMQVGGAFGGVIVSNETGVPTDGGGVGPASNPDFYDNEGFRISLRTAFGLTQRVREWTFAASLTLGAGISEWTGDIQIVLVASQDFRAGSAPLMDERFLCQFGGWYGEDGTAIGTGTHSGENAAGLTMRFGAAWYPPGHVDEIGGASEDLRVTYHRPFFQANLPNGGGVGIGQIVTDIDGNILDNCPVVTTLPATGGGIGFDRYGTTGFRMELGGDTALVGGGSFGQVVGTATFDPTRWWAHDAEDGNGPLYDTATGAWLRTPPTR